MKLLRRNKKQSPRNFFMRDIAKSFDTDPTAQKKLPIIEFHLDRAKIFFSEHKRGIFGVLGTLIFISILSAFSVGHASVAKFYPTSCLGGWEHPENAQGQSDLALDAKPEDFTISNSARISQSTGSLYCGGFKGEMLDNTKPTKFTLSFSWSVDDGSVIHPEPKPFDPSLDKNIIDQTTEIPKIDVIDISTDKNAPTDSPADSPTDQSTTQIDAVPSPTEDSTKTDLPPADSTPPPAPDNSIQSFLYNLFFTPVFAQEKVDSIIDTPAPDENPPDQFVEINYTLDGTNWKKLGTVNRSSWQKISFDIPLDAWENLDHLQIEIKTLPTFDNPATIYLDGVTMNVAYDDIVEIMNPPTVTLKDGSSIISGTSDFNSSEAVTFTITNPNLDINGIKDLVSAGDAEIVEDVAGVLGTQTGLKVDDVTKSTIDSLQNILPSAGNILQSPADTTSTPEIISTDDTTPVLPDTPLSFFDFFSPKIAHAGEPNVSAEILDLSGEKTDISVNIVIVNVDGEDRQEVHIDKGRQFKPGKYTLRVTLKTPQAIIISQQDFTWGVLAINTNKSIYEVGDDAYLQMGVLDDKGHTLCGTDLDLVITSPNGSKNTFSTGDGSIVRAKECGPDNVISVPDYYAHFTVPDQVGTYTMRLTATTANGTKSITDTFDVVQNSDFVVSRMGPSRIYPVSTYPMTIRVTAKKDWQGTVSEVVPESFDISEPEHSVIYNSVETVDDPLSATGQIKIISWNVSLVAGQETTLGYIFKAPNKSPQYYLLGEINLTDADGANVFTEARYWQIASDATANVWKGTTSVNWGTAANWSQNAVPTASDGFVTTFDSAQFNNPCTVNTSTRVANSIDFTGYTNTITMTFGITVSGSITLGASMVFAGTTPNFTINATGTITTNGKAFPNALTLAGTSQTYTLGDVTTVNGQFLSSAVTAVTLNSSTLNAHGGINITTNVPITGTTSIVMNGTGTWQLSGSASNGAAIKNNLTLAAGAGTITVSGNVYYNTGTLTYTSGTMVVTGSTLNIFTNATTLDTSGMTWASANLASATTVTLSSNWNVSATFNAGINNVSNVLNGNTLNISGSLTSSGSGVTLSGTTLLNFTGTGSITSTLMTIQNNLTINTAGTITFSGTFVYNTGTLTYTTAANVVTTGSTLSITTTATTLNTNGISWNNISLNGVTITNNSLLTATGTVTLVNAVTFAGSTGWTFGTLTWTAGAAAQSLTLAAGKTYTITTAITVAGQTATHKSIVSGTASSNATLKLNTGVTQALSFVNGTDIDSSSGDTVLTLNGTLTRTTNWTQKTTEYYVGTAGNWSSTAHWAVSSGGPGGYAVPSSTENVIIDANSPAVTVDAASAAKTVDFTGYTGTLTVNATLTVSGSVTLVSAMTITTSSGTPILAFGASGTLTSNTKVWPYQLQNTSGVSVTLTLADNWTVTGGFSVLGGAAVITLTNNALTLNGGMTIGGATAGTTSVTLGGGTWSGAGTFTNSLTFAGNSTVSGSVSYSTGTITYSSGTITTTGSTLALQNTTTLNTSGITWNNISGVNLNRTVTLTSNLVATGSFTAAALWTFNGAFTFTLGGDLTLTGSVGGIAGTAELILNGTSVISMAGASGIISCNTTINTSGTITISGTVKYSTNTFKYTAGTMAGTSTPVLSFGTASTITLNALFTYPGNITTTAVPTINGTNGFTITSFTSTISNTLAASNTYTITGDLTGASGTIVMGTSTTLNLGGLSTITNLTATATGNTVNYNGAAQTVHVNAYRNLTLSGSGAKTMTSITTLTGNFTMSGSATATTVITSLGGNADISGTAVWTNGATLPITGTLSVGTGAKLTMGNFAVTVNSTSSISGTIDTATGSTGTRTFIGAVTVGSGGIFDLTGQNPATSFAGGITMNGTTLNTGTGSTTFATSSQSFLGSSNMTFGGAVTINNGLTLTNSNTGTITFSGNVVGGNASSNFATGASSTTQFAGTVMSTGTLTPSTSAHTIEYNGGTQTIKTPTTNNYYNLTISAAGVKSPNATLNVTGTISISAGTLDTVSGSNYTINTGSLTISGTGILLGQNANINLTGNWSNSNTFTAGTSTVTMNGGTTATVSGTTTFYDFTITHSAAKEVDFQTTGTPIFHVTHTFTVTGHAAALITLRSEVGTSPTKWQFHPTGTASGDYVDVKDGGCQSGSVSVFPLTNYTNIGNNDSCWTAPPTITFAVSDSSIGFGSLLSSLVRFATGDTLGNSSETEAHNITVSTNAVNGYTLSVLGDSLTNGSHTITAIGGSNTASNPGTEQFGLRMTASGGVGAVSSPYDASGFAYAGTSSSPSTVASASSGDGVTTTYSVRYVGNISTTTTAGSYTTGLTYIVSGSF